jgi:hypothetical protein
MIYFIGSGDLFLSAVLAWCSDRKSVTEFPVKIGYSDTPDTRLAGLQTGCPDKLSILAVVPGNRNVEKRWHDWYAGHRLQGEWFRHCSIYDKIVSAFASAPFFCLHYADDTVKRAHVHLMGALDVGIELCPDFSSDFTHLMDMCNSIECVYCTRKEIAKEGGLNNLLAKVWR